MYEARQLISRVLKMSVDRERLASKISDGSKQDAVTHL